MWPSSDALGNIFAHLTLIEMRTTLRMGKPHSGMRCIVTGYLTRLADSRSAIGMPLSMA